ncbi:MAG: radical SAM protein [Planctomycetes bacterium]|nr:radical SAM protein [Planctomycetota bacterium]
MRVMKRQIDSSNPRHINESGFDPILLASAMENAACEDQARLYATFSISPNFGGSVKAHSIGCNLQCGFCWSPCRSCKEINTVSSHPNKVARVFSEVFGQNGTRAGVELNEILNVPAALNEMKPRLYQPEEVVDKMIMTLADRKIEGIGSFELCTEGSPPKTIRYFAISGGEPTIGRHHLLSVIRCFAERNLPQRFLLQTNGFLLGADSTYLEALSVFIDCLELRISLKAGNPKGLRTRTGAFEASFEYPFRAIEQAISLGFSFHLAAMSDSAVMPGEEREELFERLSAICLQYDRHLESMESYYHRVHGMPKHNDRSSLVLIDEETYVPVYPKILAEVLDS